MASKRKLIVSREPNGRPQRNGDKPKESAPAAMKRLRDEALRGMHDPGWGTELGRLYLYNTITSEMYAAGKWWTEQAAKYQSAIGAFPVKSAMLESGRGGLSPDPESPAGRKIAEREARQAEDFFKAHAVLVQAGVESVVRRLCEGNEAPCGYGELMSVRTGLLKLAQHRGFGGQSRARA